MSVKQAHERFPVVNEPVAQTVYTPAPAAPPIAPAPKQPLPPVYRPGAAAPQRSEINPLWLIPLWAVLSVIIIISLGWWSPFATTKPITMDTSINGQPPPDKPLDTSAATALTIAVGSAANTEAESTPTVEAAPAESAPVGVLVDDALPWYIFSHHVEGATFEEYNGTLIELKAVPYQDLDTRGGADNKLCRIRTIYGSALVEVWVPCWEIGKGGA